MGMLWNLMISALLLRTDSECLSTILRANLFAVFQGVDNCPRLCESAGARFSVYQSWMAPPLHITSSFQGHLFLSLCSDLSFAFAQLVTAFLVRQVVGFVFHVLLDCVPIAPLVSHVMSFIWFCVFSAWHLQSTIFSLVWTACSDNEAVSLAAGCCVCYEIYQRWTGCSIRTMTLLACSQLGFIQGSLLGLVSVAVAHPKYQVVNCLVASSGCISV